MSIIGIIIVLVVIGVILYLVNSFIPMDARIKQILNVVVVIAVILWLLFAFFPGIMSMGPRVPVH